MEVPPISYFVSILAYDLLMVARYLEHPIIIYYLSYANSKLILSYEVGPVCVRP